MRTHTNAHSIVIIERGISGIMCLPHHFAGMCRVCYALIVRPGLGCQIFCWWFWWLYREMVCGCIGSAVLQQRQMALTTGYCPVTVLGLPFSSFSYAKFVVLYPNYSGGCKIFLYTWINSHFLTSVFTFPLWDKISVDKINLFFILV